MYPNDEKIISKIHKNTHNSRTRKGKCTILSGNKDC
jgi:hypothetical protein